MDRTRARAAVVVALLMAGVALYRIAEELHATMAGPPPPTSDAVVSEARLAVLRGDLAHRGTVGYVTDAPDFAAFIERFYLAQFALAPLIVVPAADLRWVVGDFRNGGVPDTVAGSDLQVVREYGGGVMLFKVPE